jgi:hypothetical protein
MNPSPNSWQRLVAAARQSTDDRETTPRAGFATRVVAYAMAAERPAVSLLERFALRAVGVACLFALLGIAANLSLRESSAPVEDRFFAPEDPAAILWDIT